MAVRNDTGVQQEESAEQSLTIGIADYAVTTSGKTLTTNGLGSCLGVALIDAVAGVAGLIHIMRPAPDENEDISGAKFADPGIELLIDAMEQEGASQHRIEAKLAGGSNMFSFSTTGANLGSRNVEQAERVLQDLGIPITGKDVGGNQARSLHFDGHSGQLTVESSDAPNII